jgi:hypothetical protein
MLLLRGNTSLLLAHLAPLFSRRVWCQVPTVVAGAVRMHRGRTFSQPARRCAYSAIGHALNVVTGERISCKTLKQRKHQLMMHSALACVIIATGESQQAHVSGGQRLQPGQFAGVFGWALGSVSSRGASITRNIKTPPFGKRERCTALSRPPRARA